jgi:SHS2 domain-containing protein
MNHRGSPALPETEKESFMKSVQAHWEHFEHEADIGVRGIGNSKAEAYAQAALALSALITDLDLIESREEVRISCEEPDPELLFVDWLNALIFEMATRKMLFGDFQVRIEGPSLEARLWGEPICMDKHQPAVEIKGATYTELRVWHDGSGTWLAQCVVDV